MKTGKDRDSRKNIILSIVAVLAFVFLWAAAFGVKREFPERTNARILVMGDSLMGDCQDETSIPSMLSQLLGEQVYSGALGGTYFTRSPGIKKDDYNLDLMNMSNLAKAIVADDFGAQRTFRGRQTAMWYFEDALDTLESVDYNSIEILILEYGVNDYHNAHPIENKKNSMDDTTYTGAVRNAVTALRKAYPNMRIVLLTPTYAWYISDRMTCEEYDTGNGNLEKYVNSLIDVAGEIGVEVIDLYHGVYQHDRWEDWEVYTHDGLHPNEYGRRIIAERVAEYLKAGDQG